jgi:uncharacterized membrane protein YozB (DUF420 family)
MYNAALAIHSALRWVILLLALLAIVRAVSGMATRRPWTGADERGVRFLTGALDLEMLIGLIIYFALSPITREGMTHLGTAMGSVGLRFFTVEHPVGMIVAIALAHVGQKRIRRTTDAVRRHRTALIFFTITLLVILVSVPWPGRAIVGRPLLRPFGS